MRKRIGVVGLGLNNPYFYAPLLKELGADVSCVWDYTEENARAYAERFGCRVISELEHFPQVDGVLIDSRNCDHISLARPFLDKGIPVYLEKPLSSSVEEALAFLEEYREAKAFSLSPLRLAPSYLKIQQDLLATGELPVRCHVTVYHTMRFFLENPIKRWHDQPEQSGGMLTDIGIHAVELLNMFMRERVRRVTGVSTKCHHFDARCDDNYALTVEYENGAIGTISLLCATDRTDYSVEVMTPHHAFINNMDNEYTGLPKYNVDNAYGGFKGVMEAFIRMIDTGKPPVSPQETKRNFEMIARMNQALARAREE